MATREKQTTRALKFSFTDKEWELFQEVYDFRPNTIKSALMIGLKHYRKIIESEIEKLSDEVGPLDNETVFDNED